MRWVFYSLLVCNAILLAWQWSGREIAGGEFVEQPSQAEAATELVLVSEVDLRALVPRAQAATSVVEPEYPSSDPRRHDARGESSASPVCYRLGPIETDDEAEQLRAWLVAAGGALQRRLGERRELELYWVYLPPFSTRTEADRVAAEMARAGIQDIYVIARGDMAHAISLGAYSQASSLQRRLRQLRAKGYDASVLPRYRAAAGSWIDVEFMGTDGFPQQAFSLRFPHAEAIVRACDKAALRSDP